MNLKAYLNQKAKIVNKALATFAPKGPSPMNASMRYALMAGGKRLRPVLVIAGAELCGGRQADVLPAACALEYIHTYSLVHDDLPAMDDDDLRRGKPTTHRKFGEAAAILAGDALLTEAFNLVASCAGRIKTGRVLEAVKILSRNAGFEGMVGGQMKDTVETGSWKGKSRQRLLKDLEYIQLNKTAALIQASLLIGAALAGADKRRMKALDAYGRNIGHAFQIADDILDITADKKLLGKKGSDRDNNKLTYPAVIGLDRSRKMAEKLVKQAKNSLKIFGKRAAVLNELADYIINRKY